MTTDLQGRMLAKVDHVIEIVGMHETFTNEQTEIFGALFEIANALKVAVEMHGTYEDGDTCINCTEGRDSDPAPFPCPELRAIATALGVEG